MKVSLFFSHDSARFWLSTLLALIAVFLCNSNEYISMAIAALIVIVVLLNFSLGVKAYLYVLFASTAVNISLIYMKLKLVTHSIMLDTFSGFTLFTLLNAFLFFCIVILLMRRSKMLRLNKYLFFGIFLPLLVPMYGYLVNPLESAFSDSSQLIGLIVGFLLCYLSDLTLEDFFKILIPILFATMIFHMLLFVHHGFSPVYYGAIGNLYPIILLCLERLSIGQKLIFLVLTMGNLIMFPGRSRLFGYAYAFLCSCVGRFKDMKFILFIVFSFLLLGVGITYLLMHSSNLLVTMFLFKINNFFGNGVQAVSSYTRVLEFQNILALDLHQWVHFLIGGGYGSCFHDTYFPYPSWILYAGSAYPSGELATHCFLKPHLNISDLLLKGGFLFGILFFVTNLYLVFGKLRKAIASAACASEYRILYIIPFWAMVEFNSQSFVIYGVLIYFLNQALESASSIKSECMSE